MVTPDDSAKPRRTETTSESKFFQTQVPAFDKLKRPLLQCLMHIDVYHLTRSTLMTRSRQSSLPLKPLLWFIP